MIIINYGVGSTLGLKAGNTNFAFLGTAIIQLWSLDKKYVGVAKVWTDLRYARWLAKTYDNNSL